MTWGGWSRGKYRWRTWLRSHLPRRPPLYQLVGKGRGDCGNHDWYKATGAEDNCYHCQAVRSSQPGDLVNWAAVVSVLEELEMVLREDRDDGAKRLRRLRIKAATGDRAGLVEELTSGDLWGHMGSFFDRCDG